MNHTAKDKGDQPSQNQSGLKLIKKRYKIQPGPYFREKEGQPQKNALIIYPLLLTGGIDHPFIGFKPAAVRRKHGLNQFMVFIAHFSFLLYSL